jgi:ATP-dependent exoDNAse (exonuclease V) beta subunit
MTTTKKAPTKSPPLPHTVIRASAGSGKTFQLSNRYLALLHRGVAPEKILAVTFTRKAAGEIFDRIILRLAQAASDDAQRQQLAGFIEAPNLTQEKCRELLVGVTRALHKLRVGTLDSFFSKVAGSCSLELGLPLGWRIVEEINDIRLRDQAIADSLAGDSVKPVLTLLNLLTKGEAARSVSQLIRDTVQQLYNVARETEETAWKKLPKYKGLSSDQLADVRQRLDDLSIPNKNIMKEVEKDREYLAEHRLVDFISRGIAVKILEGETKYYGKQLDAETLEVYEALLKHVRFFLVNKLSGQTEATFDLLQHFRQHYERLKHTQAQLRFDDITFALSRGKDSKVADDARVTFRLDAAVDHLLLDEFQDTSLAQWNVLRPIAQRVTSSAGDTSFFCVGDTKQAIYGWRGGLAELFDAVQSELPDLEEVPLDTSYRSSPAVIEVVNEVFTRLDQHSYLEKYESAVRDWQKRFRPHSTTKTGLAGYVTLESCDRIEIEEEEGPEARDIEEEAFFDFAAAKIADAYHQSPGMTIGVLTRTNEAVTNLIYRLRNLSIPASEEGGNPLTDSCAVELILSLVRLADHPGDAAAAYHIARSPLAAAIGIKLEEYRRTAILAEKLRRELIDDGYGRAIYRWAQLLAPSCDARDRSRLQQLVELAYSHQPNSTLRPADFLQFVQRQRVSDPTTSMVRVMTVHQAKGLEFDIVILPELDSGRTLLGQPPWIVNSRDGLGGDINCVCRYTNEHIQRLLPDSFRQMFDSATDAQIGEALCVLYVAMTRAIHALHLLIRPPRQRKDKENGKPPKTFAGLLRAALCGDKSTEAGLLYEHGDANWYELEKKRRKLSPTNGAGILPALPTAPTKIVLAPPPAQRRRGLERQSPSRMEGGTAAQIRRALELTDPRRTQAMLRGTVIHAWFEQILWLDDGAPSDEQLLAALAMVRDAASLPENLRRTWLKDFRDMLRQKETVATLTKASYLKSLPKNWSSDNIQLEARNEWPFAVIEGPQITTGRMDRVVFHVRDGQRLAAEVLDFKTDVLSGTTGERLEDRVEHYRPQIEEYCKTLVQQTGLPRSQVGGVLLFVGEGVVKRL